MQSQSIPQESTSPATPFLLTSITSSDTQTTTMGTFLSGGSTPRAAFTTTTRFSEYRGPTTAARSASTPNTTHGSQVRPIRAKAPKTDQPAISTFSSSTRTENSWATINLAAAERTCL